MRVLDLNNFKIDNEQFPSYKIHDVLLFIGDKLKYGKPIDICITFVSQVHFPIYDKMTRRDISYNRYIISYECRRESILSSDMILFDDGFGNMILHFETAQIELMNMEIED